MKKIIFSSILFLISVSLFSQQSGPDFLTKSKNQKKAARILLAVGAGLITTAFVIPKGELVYDGICIGAYCDDKYKNDGIKGGLFLAGGISALSSIPLFIMSAKNRRRAASVSFKMESSMQLLNQDLVYTSFPALRLKVNF